MWKGWLQDHCKIYYKIKFNEVIFGCYLHETNEDSLRTSLHFCPEDD